MGESIETLDDLIRSWRQKAVYWANHAAHDAADDWIKERSIARAQIWTQAADELASLQMNARPVRS